MYVFELKNRIIVVFTICKTSLFGDSAVLACFS